MFCSKLGQFSNVSHLLSILINLSVYILTLQENRRTYKIIFKKFKINSLQFKFLKFENLWKVKAFSLNEAFQSFTFSYFSYFSLILL